MSTFLACTAPAAGHAFPLVPGLLALQERGHSVHVRTAAALVPALRAAGLDAAPVDPAVEAIRVGDHEARGGIGRLRRGYADLVARARRDGPDLDAAIAETAPDAVLVDVLAYGAQIAAERDGRPWALTVPSLLPLPEPGIPPYGLGLAPRTDRLGRLRDRALWPLVERLYGSALLPGLNALRGEHGLAPLASPLDLFASPARVLALTGAPLEYPRRALPPHVRLVGAQPWDPPAAVPEWLDEPGDPWVLVTCSTEYQGDERLAAAAVEALRDAPVRLLVTLADAHATAALPRAANVRVERFVAHGPVLERAAAVICHGGMGIVQKTVAAGLPLVVVPFGRDQPEVARRVTECGAGVALPAKRLTPRRLRTAFDAATAGRDAARAAGVRLRAAGGPGAFADAAEELAGLGAARAAAAPTACPSSSPPPRG